MRTLLLGLTFTLLAAPAAKADALSSAKVALRVDSLLAEEIAAAGSEADASSPPPLGQLVDDETFLRRVTFDLVGQPPSPEEITAFSLDTSADKRAKLVHRLLADPRYGVNWGRYWRDVFLSRRTDDRALLAAVSGQNYLADSFNQGRPWNQISRELLTASGSLASEGRTVLLASQWGETPDMAAEVSRVLLGVQIQCAQCHDHPTDRWKREQFHELAAFFPRTLIKPIRDGEKRLGFELATVEAPRRASAELAKLNPKRAKRIEYFTPDLNDPSALGQLTAPRFFLTGHAVPLGAGDSERREQLADWITSPDNPWFAKAVVNRLWGELVGEGFYEQIDDMGPDRDCSAPRTLELLSKQFVRAKYDLRWLLRTIVLTDAYQRESRPRRSPHAAPFASNCWQPLRGDQLFDQVTAALGFAEPPGSNDDAVRPQRVQRSPRGLFNAAFGFDPSDPREEVKQSVPQALVLMNGPAIQQALDGRSPRTALGKLLAKETDDEAVVVELYLRSLARQPSEAETARALAYVAEVGDRVEAFEDLQWALLNCTEFLYRQ